MSVYAGPEIPNSGLVLALDAANTKSYPGSGTAWTDLISRSNSTLINGPTFDSSNSGNIVFDGINDSASLTSLDLSSTNAITFCCWLKFTASSNMLIAEHSSNYNAINGFLVNASEFGGAGALQFSDHVSSYNIAYTSPGYNDAKWHYFCAVSDRSLGATNQISLYVDAVYDKIQHPTWVTDNNGNYSSFSFFIAARNSAAFFAPMNLGVLQIYNRALSAAEIKQNFNAVRGRYGI